jgi:cytochrome P450
MKIEKKLAMPFLMATMVILTGSNTHTLLGHNFSPDESASFLALVNTIKAEAQLAQQNIASNNMSLASEHANKASALMTDYVNKEIAERNQRLSDDLNTDIVSLKISTESVSGNNTASDTDLLVDDIDGILDEIVTARIDPDQLKQFYYTGTGCNGVTRWSA